MISRAKFIKNLISLYGLSFFPLEFFKEYQKVYLLQFFVRGFKYYKGSEIINQINKYGLVELRREPNNEYDEKAIAIYYENIKIGYVPYEDNYVLSNIIDAKLLKLQAEIAKIEPDAATWEQINIAIFALKETNENIPEFLTKIEKPSYHTLKEDDKSYKRVYFNDKQMIDGNEFYKRLIDNSSNDRIYDVIHNTFENSEELQEAVNESRFIINKNRTENFNANDLYEKINEQILEIENTFDEDGYVVASIDKISQMPDKIKKFVNVIDKTGNKFIEIIVKNTS